MVGMSNLPVDEELMSLFSLEEEEEDSDDEFYFKGVKSASFQDPWRLEEALKVSEKPYDKSVKIQQSNRELFSSPLTKRKVANKVQFNLIPQVVARDSNTTVTVKNNNNNSEQEDKKEEARRRQTPIFIPPPLPAAAVKKKSGKH